MGSDRDQRGIAMTTTTLAAGGHLHGSTGGALETYLRRPEGIHGVAANSFGGTVTVVCAIGPSVEDTVRHMRSRSWVNFLSSIPPLGRFRALSRRTRDMPVLVGWSVGAGQGFRVAEVFCAASVVLLAFPITAGLLYPSFRQLLRPEIAALTMAGTSLSVAMNAILLESTRLPGVRRTRLGEGVRRPSPVGA